MPATNRSVRTQDDKERYTNIGAALCGLTNPHVFYEPFDSAVTGTTTAPSRWSTTNVTNGTLTSRSTLAGGVLTQTTGGLANSSIDLLTNATLLRSTKNQAWYLNYYGALTTAIDAQTFAMVELEEASVGNVIGFGCRGASGNVTTFHMMYDLAGAVQYLDLSVPFDTAKHRWEAWSIGSDSKIYTRLDGGAIQSVTNAAGAASENVYLRINARNGTTAAARTWQHRSLLLLTPEE